MTSHFENLPELQKAYGMDKGFPSLHDAEVMRLELRDSDTSGAILLLELRDVHPDKVIEILLRFYDVAGLRLEGAEQGNVVFQVSVSTSEDDQGGRATFEMLPCPGFGFRLAFTFRSAAIERCRTVPR